MSDTLTQQHQTIRNSEVINWHKLHQYRWYVGVGACEGEPEDG